MLHFLILKQDNARHLSSTIVLIGSEPLIAIYLCKALLALAPPCLRQVAISDSHSFQWVLQVYAPPWTSPFSCSRRENAAEKPSTKQKKEITTVTMCITHLVSWEGATKELCGNLLTYYEFNTNYFNANSARLFSIHFRRNNIDSNKGGLQFDTFRVVSFYIIIIYTPFYSPYLHVTPVQSAEGFFVNSKCNGINQTYKRHACEFSWKQKCTQMNIWLIEYTRNIINLKENNWFNYRQ